MNVWARWNLEPIVLIGVALTAVLYGRGVAVLWHRAGRGRGIRSWQVGCFSLGLAVTLGAVVSPLAHASELLLSAHMAQHAALMLGAGPLLVLGAPATALAMSAPTAFRRILRRLSGRPLARSAAGLAGHPVVVLVAHISAVWAWHVPSLYEASLRNEAVHTLEHTTFLGTAALFWWVALKPHGHRRLARGADVLYVFAGGLQSSVLGGLFVFAASPLYGSYAALAPRVGVDALADQQLAGLLMWVPGGLVYLAAAAALFVLWLRSMEDDVRREETRAAVFARGPT